MYSFRNDYSEGALPEVLDALCRTNLLSTCGYGMDEYCKAAADKIRQRFACENADVHFLVGGTQTNTTAIAAFLRPWEAVIAADTGHIAVHETGAIEARGHKVCTITAPDGKLDGDLIRKAMEPYLSGSPEHMVKPKMVYISDSTELGTIYTCAELAEISKACHDLGLALYLDGARMGVALTAEGNDLQPEDFARYCDAFYIGGTKNGLLFGEALVIVREEWKPCFRSMIKQCGGMLAKGRLLGIQFSALMQDDLWLAAARHSNLLAKRLADGLEKAGYQLYVQSPTNQVFVLLTSQEAEFLAKDYCFEFFCAGNGQENVYRFVTSWATKSEWVDALLHTLPKR